jgi:hypothetical protein
MTVYKENQGKVLGSIAIPKRNQDTFGRDVEEIITKKYTFDEAIRSSESSIMTKQRLRVVQRDLFAQLDALELTGSSVRAEARPTECLLLLQLETIVTPETLMTWHRKLIAKKYDGSAQRRPGRTRTAAEVETRVAQMAEENRDWGLSPH